MFIMHSHQVPFRKSLTRKLRIGSSLNIYPLLVWCVLAAATLFLQVEADRYSGLCPSGYPRRVAFNGTNHCYPVGNQGPCGKMMVVASDPYRPNFGICRCKSLGSSCFGRPILDWEDRCYFEFSQGPCRKGHWLVRGKHGYPSCQKSPCPLIENQRDLLRADFPRKNFYFTINNSYECYMTGTQAFCEDDQRAFFLGSESFPRCLSYEPWDCDYYSAPAITIRQGDPRPAAGFGVPYDGI
ncbi:unnamed protein product [Orchesella dallaii]|uniref:DUF4789 domain-containing protein n=1 Tax=Orchesella dallaii TaxID=48710 RepID=A0ABP1QZ05_9HEXA